jgi:hypothetical protein
MISSFQILTVEEDPQFWNPNPSYACLPKSSIVRGVRRAVLDNAFLYHFAFWKTAKVSGPVSSELSSKLYWTRTDGEFCAEAVVARAARWKQTITSASGIRRAIFSIPESRFHVVPETRLLRSPCFVRSGCSRPMLRWNVHPASDR